MTDTFIKTFVNTLIYNVVTIVAIVVAVVSYTWGAIQDWYNQGGRELLLTAAANVAASVNKLSEKVYYTLEDAETLTM